MVRRLSIIVVLLFGGCGTTTGPSDGSLAAGGSTGSSGGSPRPFVQIASDLPDGATSAGQGPFVVSFYGAGRMLDDPTMEHLISRLAVRTWPEGAAVAVSVTADPTSTTSMARVQVAPSSPLDDRWYVLDFGPAEDGLLTNQTLPDGTWGARLRPGSHPAVRLIELCGANVPGLKLVTSFSETVGLDGSSQPFTVTQGGQVVSCPPYGTGGNTLYAFCATLHAGEMTIALDPTGLHGQTGTPLSAGSWTFDSRTLSQTSSGCQGFRVPIE